MINKLNPGLEKTLTTMIFGSLMILALGLVTSTSLLALSHILMFVPAVYFLTRADYKSFPKSSWALLVMIVIIFLSVVFNQDIAVNGLKPVLKIKYFLFGFLSIAPLQWYFKNHITEKKISYLLYAFFAATTFATLAGLYGLWSGFNPVLFKVAHPTRNSGLFGMLMNYAHNLSFFLIIVSGLMLYRHDVKKFINVKILTMTFVINLVGFYFTYTRGAWIAYLVAICFFCFKEFKKFFFGIFAGMILLGSVMYFVAGDKIVRPQSEIERLSQWQAAVMAFTERPILGFGYLNFEQHASEIKKRYNLPAQDFQGHAHNNFLEMLASTGLLGLIAFVAWLILWFKEMLQRTDTAAKIGLPFIIVFVVGGLTQSTISLGINLFFIMGIYPLVSSINIQEDKNVRSVN